ncbi:MULTISPECIES: TRAP transporter small permease [Thalassospira]|uniref:TRAP transporter small permease protein n=2 Tax=Thalassospira TaxID=168934 RepID=A0A367WEJ9_9PROT|nr:MULTISPECIES: TRAP transporter small permease [Thalassospira]MDG4718836.1 TRAP transporter small permease [Thalassospira sp. FZY0004]RCK39807.1 C4-dicarboxylate ABC transporter substrate-binding protein [Thalassospira profundimaris]
MLYARLYAFIIALCRIGTGAAFGLLICTVLIQVFSRTFLPSSPVWTEELTRHTLLFLAAFGVGLSFRNGELVNVDIVCEMLPLRVQRALAFISAGITAGFCLILLSPAWMFVSIGVLQTSPALGVRMDFIHATVFILLVVLGLFAVLRMVRVIAGVSDGKAEDTTKDFP